MLKCLLINLIEKNAAIASCNTHAERWARRSECNYLIISLLRLHTLTHTMHSLVKRKSGIIKSLER